MTHAQHAFWMAIGAVACWALIFVFAALVGPR